MNSEIFNTTCFFGAGKLLHVAEDIAGAGGETTSVDSQRRSVIQGEHLVPIGAERETGTTGECDMRERGSQSRFSSC